LFELYVLLLARLVFDFFSQIKITGALIFTINIWFYIPDIKSTKIYVNRDFQTLCYACMLMIAMGFGITILLPASVHLSNNEMCLKHVLVIRYFGDIENFWTTGVFFFIHMITAALQTLNMICSVAILILGCGSMSAGFKQAW